MSSDEPPPDTAALGALLLADARLPTGSHTQSGGLEPALQAGMDPADVPAFLRTRLRTTTLVEAGTAVVALAVARRGDPVTPVVDAWAARTPSQHVRAASIEVGRGYQRVLNRLAPGTLPRDARLPRPIALALLAAHLRLTPEALARAVCHDDVQAVGAAALKLTPMDPLDTVAWTLGVADDVEQVVEAVRTLRSPDDIPSVTAPLTEQWQHRHATTTRRLFRA